MQINRLKNIAILLAIIITAVQAGYILCAVTSSAAAKDTQRAAVVADEKHAVIRVMIDGKEIARFDSGGLRIEGGVFYSPQSGAAPVIRKEPPDAR
jgi:ABC-type protease/lipase transport system fused ATPase/permease subunit